MITLLCFLLLIVVFGKLGIFALRAAWGLTRIMFSLIFLPAIIIGFIFSGLFVLAIPLLILIGIGTLIITAAS